MAARRLRTRDALLLGGVVAAWSACFVLHLQSSLRGQLAWIPVVVAPAADPAAGPEVRGFWSEADAARTGLAAGDRLLAAGGESLRGRGPLGVAARLHGHSEPGGEVPVRVEREGAQRELRVRLQPIDRAWRPPLLAVAFFAVGALSFWRAANVRAARLLFFAMTAYSLHWCYFWGSGPAARNLAAFAVFAGGLGAALPLAMLAIQAFPEDVARRGRAAALWPWAFAIVGLGAASWAFGGPLPPAWGLPVNLVGSVAALVAMALLLARQWAATGPIGRRQIKWVLLGAIAAFLPPSLFGVAALARPDWWWLYEASLASLVLLPLAVCVALVRDHLFDVDRLLTATALTSVLGALLLGSLIGLVPSLASAAQAVVDPQLSQPALGLLASLGFLGLRARLQPQLDRWLFPESERFERGSFALRGALAACEKPGDLLRALGEGVAELLRPEAVAVYGHAGEVFAPLLREGRADAPPFAADGPLAAALGEAGRVLDVATASARLGDDPAGRADRAALAASGAELLLPVVLRGRLEAFACLGAKRSGRDYGSGELALLQSLADKAADELRRFALEEVHRDQRVMVERLRRYVPGAVAARLEQGAEPPSGEREVSVLFVDIRGYTGLSEQRDPEAIFSFVTRYTERVSTVVQAHGGAIVDFQGDGLMAVFGAPEPHPHKEQAAVAAAREIVARVRDLPLDAAGGERPDLGVGVATGPAFVGNVRSVERTIWAVLGDTTNLAARCQALTRELAASIVIDARTHRAAGAPADFAEHPQTAVRGRRARVDLFVLGEGRGGAR